MALLSGLPVPQMTSPTDGGRSGGRGMSNFIQLMSLIQGGKADAAKTAAKTAENENFARGATLAQDWWKGVKDPNNLSPEEVRSGAVLSAHPFAGKYMKMGADFQKQVSDNENALLAAADNKRFAERKSKIDPETRSLLDEMYPTEKGTPSSQMWSVLTTGEENMRAVEAAAKQEASLLSPTAMNQRDNTAERVRMNDEKLKNKPLSEIDNKLLNSAITAKRNAESDLADPVKGSVGKEQLEKIIRDSDAVINRFTPKGAAPPAAPNQSTGKIVIQNGNRFRMNADGSAEYLGPAK